MSDNDSDVFETRPDEDPRVADIYDANHVRYCCCGIVRLRSGEFALFSPFDNDEGIDLMAVGDLATIAPLIFSAEDCERASRRFKTRREGVQALVAEFTAAAAPQPLGIRRRA